MQSLRVLQLQAEASGDTEDTEPDPVNYTEVPVPPLQACSVCIGQSFR